MNMTTGASPTNWDRPEPSSNFVAKHHPTDVATWRKLRDGVVEAGQINNWNKSEVARRIDMPDSTFSQWLSGTLGGTLSNHNVKAAQWLDAMSETSDLASTMRTSPGFLKTAVAIDILQTLKLAQVTSGLVMITLPAGRGKTYACKHYRATRPHVFMATISPKTRTVNGMLLELAAELDVHEFNPANLVRTIGRKIQRVGDGTLLIIDEAQNLDTEAVNQIRHFPDNYGCGVALVGNSAIAKRFGKEVRATASKDQVTSRFDKHLKSDRDLDGDLKIFIEGWGIEDAASVKFLYGLGVKGGALRQIDRTLKLAHMIAAGAGEDMAYRHIVAAWKNRDVEDMG